MALFQPLTKMKWNLSEVQNGMITAHSFLLLMTPDEFQIIKRVDIQHPESYMG